MLLTFHILVTLHSLLKSTLHPGLAKIHLSAMCTGKCTKCIGHLLFPLGLFCIIANILLFFPNGEVWRTEEITEKIWFFPGVIGGGLLVGL